jgi:hypothetical protein
MGNPRAALGTRPAGEIFTLNTLETETIVESGDVGYLPKQDSEHDNAGVLVGRKESWTRGLVGLVGEDTSPSPKIRSPERRRNAGSRASW